MIFKIAFQRVVAWATRYPVIVIAIAIFGYYLIAAIDMFKKTGKMQVTPLDFVLQFNSLIWMWIAAFVFLKLQKTKEKFYGEEREKLTLQYQVEKSKMASALLQQITKQLQDTINNPLAIIGVMTKEIRKEFRGEPDVMRRLDQIDVSLKRIHNAIKDIATYQTAQVLEALQKDMESGGLHSPSNSIGESRVMSEVRNPWSFQTKQRINNAD
jgi:hypothetical protein